MTDSSHWQRAEPTRTAPHRDGWAQTTPMQGAASQAGSTVQQAVRIGYQVIEDNIEQGREAAARISKGSYGYTDAQSDILQLSNRLLQASRDLTSTYFDALESLIREATNDRRKSPRDER